MPVLIEYIDTIVALHGAWGRLNVSTVADRHTAEKLSSQMKHLLGSFGFFLGRYHLGLEAGHLVDIKLSLTFSFLMLCRSHIRDSNSFLLSYLCMAADAVSGLSLLFALNTLFRLQAQCWCELHKTPLVL